MPTTYEPIQSVTATGSSTIISFTSIPQTYKHLQLRILGANNDSGSSYNYIQFNGDTGNNYAAHQLFGDGSSAQANGFTGINQIYIQRIPGSITNTFGGVVLDILDYALTTKNKTVRMLGGFDANGSGRISLSSGLWLNTNAVTSMTLGTGGTLWLQNSQVALYGIKG